MNAYLSEGTYYIRVTTDDYWHSTADYTLCVNYTENQGEYEIEPNNSQDNATLIEVDEPVTGNLRTSSDVDYYRFVMPDSEKYIWDLTIQTLKEHMCIGKFPCMMQMATGFIN